MSWQILIFHHVLKDTKADTLPLQRLMHIEVKYASWINLLLLAAACDEERLVPSLEQGQRLISLHDHEQVLIALRINQLAMSRYRVAESLSYRTCFSKCVNNISDLTTYVADIFALHQDNRSAVGQCLLDATL